MSQLKTFAAYGAERVGGTIHHAFAYGAAESYSGVG